VTAFLPVGTVSSSTQLPSGIPSSSAQVIAYLPSDTVSSSTQVTAFLPTNTVSSSGQVTAFLPGGTVSSSGQISLNSISGTTFSNNDFNFPLNVTVNGLLTATSQSIIYITSSQLNVGSNDIVLNTTEQLRFGGLTVFDSGSANQSGSLFWDSLNNVWLYVHAGTSNTSSILITGPENTGVLGSETFLTANRIPKAGLIGDHIVDSQISDNGTTVGMTGNLSVTGSLTIATNALFVSSSGNIGIGVANTSTVGARVKIATTTRTAKFFDLDATGGENWIIDSTNTAGSTDVLGIYAYGATGLYIKDDGNVGIGTVSPTRVLTVYTSGSDSRIILQNNGTGTAINNGFDITMGTDGVASVWNYQNSYMRFATNNTERMRIDESGKVGIGIASPVQKLHIEGNAAIGTTGTEDILLLGRAISGGVSFQQAASFKLGRYQNAGGSFESYTRLDIALRDNSAASNYNTNTTVMTLTNAGNVGIGTTNPVVPLEVIGIARNYRAVSGNTSLLHDWYSDNGGTKVLQHEFQVGGNAYHRGNVGIGTTNPAYHLQVRGAGTTTFGNVKGVVNFNDDSAAVKGVGLGYDTSGQIGVIYSETAAAASTLTFWTYSGTTWGERFRIGSAGGFTAQASTSVASGTYSIQDNGSSPNTIRVYNNTDSNNTGNRFIICDAGASILRAEIRSNGGIANYSANNVALSDARVKTDITPVESMWNKVSALEIVTYKYTDQTHDDVNVGVIAQQVESVEPVWVDNDGYGETPEGEEPLKTVYTTDITFAAIKALQEAMVRIETLEAEVAALKNQ
jgi:hypothetical protein